MLVSKMGWWLKWWSSSPLSCMVHSLSNYIEKKRIKKKTYQGLRPFSITRWLPATPLAASTAPATTATARASAWSVTVVVVVQVTWQAVVAAVAVVVCNLKEINVSKKKGKIKKKTYLRLETCTCLEPHHCCHLHCCHGSPSSHRLHKLSKNWPAHCTLRVIKLAAAAFLKLTLFKGWPTFLKPFKIEAANVFAFLESL